MNALRPVLKSLLAGLLTAPAFCTCADVITDGVTHLRVWQKKASPQTRFHRRVRPRRPLAQTFLRRRAIHPTVPRPISSSAYVSGSGTGVTAALVVSEPA